MTEEIIPQKVLGGHFIMMRSMYSAVSGLKTHQTKMDVIGNNIANVNTVAFKSSSVTFQDILYQTTSGASGANVATGIGGVNAKQIGLGVSMASTSVSIETAGASETTGNPFDIKLTDKNTTNFFVVNDGSQNLFTRAGSFYVDGVGNLCMTSTGYMVMGWQVDETTNEIRKDTVSALRIMQEKNLTCAPEATTNAVMGGVLDENDADVQSDNGKVMNLNFYDSLGYQYTARFSVKATGEDGKYKVSLTSILNDDNEDIIGKYTAEERAKLFGDYEEVESEYAVLSPVEGEFTIDPATGTVSDGVNTYALNATGDAFEYSDGTTTHSYSVGDIFGADAAAKMADGYKLSFDSTNGVYTLVKDIVTSIAPTDATAHVVNPDGTITAGGATYTYNATSGMFEDGTGATLSVEDVFGTDIADKLADASYSIAYDAAEATYTLVQADSAEVTPGESKFKVNTDGTITDGVNTYTLNEAGDAFVYTDGETTVSYSLAEVFGEENVAVLTTDPTSYSLEFADGQYSIIKKTVVVEEEVDTVYSDAALNEGFKFQEDGTIINEKTNLVYEYVSGTEFKVQGTDEVVTADVIFNMTENMQQNLGIGIGKEGLNTNSDYEFKLDEDGQFVVTRKNPNYILEFNTATGVFDSINGDPKSVSLKLGDALGENNFNKNGNFENISIDFTQCLNYNNGGKSTIGMDAGDTDGTTGKGRKLGNMIGVSIDTNGKIYGSYDNGNTKLLGQIAVAQFSNAAGLAKVGESCYQTTLNSGDFDGIGVEISADGSSMTTGELEMSNVDLSTEFTQMITTQRGFQANSRVITTSDTLLEELVNLKR